MSYPIEEKEQYLRNLKVDKASFKEQPRGYSGSTGYPINKDIERQDPDLDSEKSVNFLNYYIRSKLAKYRVTYSIICLTITLLSVYLFTYNPTLAGNCPVVISNKCNKGFKIFNYKYLSLEFPLLHLENKIECITERVIVYFNFRITNSTGSYRIGDKKGLHYIAECCYFYVDEPFSYIEFFIKVIAGLTLLLCAASGFPSFLERLKTSLTGCLEIIEWLAYLLLLLSFIYVLVVQ